MEKLLPTTMIIISLAAALVYAHCKDYNKALYWFFTAGLTTTVTYQ